MPLEYLNLAHLPVSDVSLLKDMTELGALVLDDTKVTDLSALKGLPLKSLRIYRTNVSDLAPLKEMPLQQLGITFWPARHAEVLRSLTGLEQINDMPATEFWKAQK
jgi:internalin A